jgi:mono/diheme cytochrome c family protein
MRLPSPRYVVLVVCIAVAIAVFGQRLLRREEATPPTPGSLTGRSLYEAHCAVCHGVTGKGDGPGATVVRQPIRDFSDSAAMQVVDDRFLFEIIKKGGSQFGRSNAMPSWGMQLSDDEIRSVVAYIRSLAAGARTGPGGRKETP